MKTIVEYLNDLKEKNGSDYRTAQLLEISKEAVSQIRKKGKVADETAIKIADLLNVDRIEVLMAATIARSQGEVKRSWLEASKRAGIAASIALVAVMLGGFSDQAEKGTSKLKEFDNLYIMRNYGCRYFSFLQISSEPDTR